MRMKAQTVRALLLGIGASIAACSSPPGPAPVTPEPKQKEAPLPPAAVPTRPADAVLFEDFRDIADGEVPPDWQVGTSLGVMQRGRDRCLGSMRVVCEAMNCEEENSQKVSIPVAAEWPQDVSLDVDAVVDPGLYGDAKVKISAGDVSATLGGGSGNLEVWLTDTQGPEDGMEPYVGRRTTWSITRKGDVYKLLADGKSLAMARIPDLEATPASIVLEALVKDICIYRVYVHPL